MENIVTTKSNFKDYFWEVLYIYIYIYICTLFSGTLNLEMEKIIWPPYLKSLFLNGSNI